MRTFSSNLINATRQTWPKPKVLILSYPHNPTTEVVDLAFFEKIVDYAKEHNIMIIHDFAYADLTFDGYRAPASCRCRAPRTWGWNSSPCPKATACPAGGWVSASATRKSFSP
jgi:alanine-synthesizing transaminase